MDDLRKTTYLDQNIRLNWLKFSN